MRRKITSLALALIFSLSLSGVSLAATCKGTVTKIEGKVMTIQIKGRCKVKCGQDVTVKPKRRAVEGC
ncbi:MAG: hypothetical protein GWP10_02370 [Nitrospiraceae bacterium]|nr:hypothetical protein [Nitrospiraceae bacterium]